MIHLVYCIDKNYLEPTLVSAASAAIWATEAHPQTIHIVIDSNPKEALEGFISRLKELNSQYVQVEVHFWEGRQFDCFQKWHGTSIIYARLELPNILPTVDHVISLDGDTLWLDDPWKLEQLFDCRKMMQASLDPPPPSGGEIFVFKRWFAKHKLAKVSVCALDGRGWMVYDLSTPCVMCGHKRLVLMSKGGAGVR